MQFHWLQPVLHLDCEATFPETKEKPAFFHGFTHNCGDALTFELLLPNMRTRITRSVVRAAKDTHRPNHRVQFMDEVEKTKMKFKQEEHQLPESHDKDRRRPGSGNAMTKETNVASRTRAKQGPIGDVSNRTRSKTGDRNLGHLNTTVREEPNKKGHFECRHIAMTIRNILLFSLIPALMWVGTRPSSFEQFNTLFDELGTPEAISHRATVNDMSPKDWEQLKYLHMLDQHEEEGHDPWNSVFNHMMEEGTDLWEVNHISQHRISNGKAEVKCHWNDINKAQSWVNMDSVVLQDPIPVLKYAKKKHLLDQPLFKNLSFYCTGDAPSRLARAFKAKQVTGKKYMFGVQVPVGIKQALRLDRENGNTLWEDAVRKELNQLNECKTFRVLDEREQPPEGCLQIPYHIVFATKFDLRRKARLVASGNWTELVKEDICSGVVGMEIIRIGFFLGELNHLRCCAADVGNACLHSKTKEKVCLVAGPEFSELEGRILIIYKALYGLRTSAACFWQHIAEKLRSMGYKNSKADHNMWLKDNGSYYSYIALCVDDVLCWNKDPMKDIEELKECYILKGVGEPEYYLGGDVMTLNEQWQKEGICLAFSAKTYVKNIVPKFEKLLNMDFKLSTKTPMSSELHPELDDSPFLSADDAAKYRSVIGSLNWLITLGRMDVHYATSSLSRYGMAPREGHMKALCRILAYLKANPEAKILFDTSKPDHSTHVTEIEPSWTDMYPGAEEELPPDMPEPKGNSVRMTVYKDSSHACDLLTRRSTTGIVLFLNNTLTRWVSKRQKTVESSTYGSELIAARTAIDLIVEVRYQLRMLGVPLDGPTLMLGDNKSVVISTAVPSSVLKKKHCSICWHRVREAIASKAVRFVHIDTSKNVSDVLTKPLDNIKFNNIIRPLLFRQPEWRLSLEKK